MGNKRDTQSFNVLFSTFLNPGTNSFFFLYYQQEHRDLMNCLILAMSGHEDVQSFLKPYRHRHTTENFPV